MIKKDSFVLNRLISIHSVLKKLLNITNLLNIIKLIFYTFLDTVYLC